MSSTFDSIPFVREYLQKEIEGQLRNLFMEDLPAIIHRLSLRLWCPESGIPLDEGEVVKEHIKDEMKEFDPFASPPQDAVDAYGNVLDAQEISNLSLEGGSETHSLFSQKNLLRLAALTDSQRTLSLFTPSIREAVFRAWASPAERGEGSGSGLTPSLSRSQSGLGSMASSGTTYTFSDNGAETTQHQTRPSLTSLPSTTGLSLGSGRHSRTHRKKKNRVVNLRRNRSSDDTASESGDSTTETESSFASVSEPIAVPERIPEEPEEELLTPPRSPAARVRFRTRQDSIDLGETITPLARQRRDTVTAAAQPEKPIPTVELEPVEVHSTEFSRLHRPSMQHRSSVFPAEKSSLPLRFGSPSPSDNGSIVAQAWMMKMASEIARQSQQNNPKASVTSEGFWQREDSPPPAYEVQ